MFKAVYALGLRRFLVLKCMYVRMSVCMCPQSHTIRTLCGSRGKATSLGLSKKEARALFNVKLQAQESRRRTLNPKP